MEDKWTHILFIAAIMTGIYLYNRRATTAYDYEPPAGERIPCAAVPSMMESKADCEASMCLWKESKHPLPKCFLPKDLYGYQVEGEVPELMGDMTRIAFNLSFNGNSYSPFAENAIGLVEFQLVRYSDHIVRFKLKSAIEERYEVPVQEEWEFLRKARSVADPQYVFRAGKSSNNFFTFTIKRKGTDTALIDTSIGGLVLSSQFLQFVTYVPTTEVYGFGESGHKTLRHKFDFRTLAMFSRDEAPVVGRNLYGVHPFYLCLESSGQAHGVLFLNSNAAEYTLLSAPAIRLAAIGGVLDFFVFVGDNPNHVVELYTEVVGRPSLPPYWALGFHLSRNGYKSLENLKKVVARNRDAGIPQDVQHLDIEYMDNYTMFTIDPVKFGGLQRYLVEEKKSKRLRFVLNTIPALPGNRSDYEAFESGQRKGAFITWPAFIPVDQRLNPDNVNSSYDIMFGQLWPSAPVAYIDFFKDSAGSWWRKMLNEFRVKLRFDGLSLSMNEPSEFSTYGGMRTRCLALLSDGVCWHLRCPKTIYEDPVYPTGAATSYGPERRLRDRTLCMVALQGNKGQYLHYDVHNLYGWSQSRATYRAMAKLTRKRTLILSRSTYPSSGRYGGHWLGDNKSRWNELHRSIIGILEFNMFGIPYVGADICGYRGSATEEICVRWMQLGAFYPFCRNHNHASSRDQDPAVYRTAAIAVMRSALQVRYALLPYLYTLFYEAHKRGTPVVRPLFHEYPRDTQTFGIDTQFMWGRALLISPILEERQTYMSFYIPPGIWYNWYSYEPFQSTGEYMVLNSITLETPTPLYVRGGSVVPTQNLNMSTEERHGKPFALIIFPDDGKAAGELFWDDGVSASSIDDGEYNHYSFVVAFCQLTISNAHVWDSSPAVAVDKIVLSNAAGAEGFHVNGEKMPSASIRKISEQALEFKVQLSLQDLKSPEDKIQVKWHWSNQQCLM